MIGELPLALLQPLLYDLPGCVRPHLAHLGNVGAVGRREAIQKVGDLLIV